MANAPQASTSTLFKFSSPSLTNSDILDARSGEVKYRLRPGRTPDTVLVDHGGFIGLKSTCINRLSSIMYDEGDKELGRVSWDADGRPVRMWLTGGDYGRAGLALPPLCSEDGAADVDSRIITGWEIQTSLRVTWHAHVEGAAMFMFANGNPDRMLALFSPNMVRGEAGHGFLRMRVTPVDVVETVLTAIVAEASRRFVFDLGSLDPKPMRTPTPPKARRSSIVGRFTGIMRRSNSDSSESGSSASEKSPR